MIAKFCRHFVLVCTIPFFALGATQEEIDAANQLKITQTCNNVFELMSAAGVTPKRVERDMAGYVRFVMSHGPNGRQLSADEAKALITALLEDPATNPLRKGVANTLSTQDISLPALARLGEVAQAIRRTDRDSVPAERQNVWDAVQQASDFIYKDFQAMGMDPRSSAGNSRQYFDAMLRKYTVPHAMVMVRLTGSANYSDCALRGLRDMFYDDAIRAKPEFAWLAKAYAKVGGDFSKFTHLTPAYDEPGSEIK